MAVRRSSHAICSCWLVCRSIAWPSGPMGQDMLGPVREQLSHKVIPQIQRDSELCRFLCDNCSQGGLPVFALQSRALGLMDTVLGVPLFQAGTERLQAADIVFTRSVRRPPMALTSAALDWGAHRPRRLSGERVSKWSLMSQSKSCDMHP